MEGDRTSEDEAPPTFLALIGSVDGPADLAERHDDYIRERMRQHGAEERT